jgi:4-alpha-glucanotransferase
MPAGADDRFFYDSFGERLGHLGTVMNLDSSDYLGLIDQWLGVNIQWTSNRQASLWTFPIETVSQSEAGFELVHQSVCLMPHWCVQGDSEGRWSVAMDLIVTCEHEPNSRSAKSGLAHKESNGMVY